jgi:hypothetical protein
LRIASRREDGTLRKDVIIWMARVGDELYVRSAHGTDNQWFRRAEASGGGRISAGNVESDVRWTHVTEAPHAKIDAAYQAKYGGRYPQEYIDPVIGATAASATLRLEPA